MINFFSPAIIKEIRLDIERILIETFHVMLSLDVVVIPGIELMEGQDRICSYLKMKHGSTEAVLALSTSRTVVNLLCDRIEQGVSPHSEALITDVISELTNIVANHLRTKLNYSYDILFDVSLPHSGCIPDVPHNVHVLKIYFVLDEADRFNVNLTCDDSDQIGRAHV